MSTAFRRGLVVAVALLAGLAVFLGGTVLSRWSRETGGYVPNAYAQGRGPQGSEPGQVYTDTCPCGIGMGGFGASVTLAPAPSAGVSMMGGYGMYGMTGMMGQGHAMMMGAGSNALYGIKPLSLGEAKTAVESYLANLGDDNLAVREVMTFDNHAYAEVVEVSTGVSAFEVLVDPVTKAVAPEPGPNMMWNLKYSPMAGFDMMGMMGNFGLQQRDGMMGRGMMGGSGTPADISADMPVSPEDAIDAAQRYLDRFLPGAQAVHEADTFYGYYTLHIERDGETVGMLSVNGYTRQVFVHIWHGDLLAISEETHS